MSYDFSTKSYFKNVASASYTMYTLLWNLSILIDSYVYSTVNDQDAPCVVCDVEGRSSTLMVPGTHVCPGGWVEEYRGYLVSTHHTYHRAEFICVDQSPQGLYGGHGNTNGALLYYVRAKCGALLCPPYTNEREVTCVVCTK